MSLTNFYLINQVVSECIDSTFKLSLEKEDIHHAKVLRLKPGEHIGVIDSNNVYYECEITKFDNEIYVKNSVKNTKLNKNKINITLCPGILKNNKLDSVIKSCTEIGVNKFIPLIFDRSVVEITSSNKIKKINRWKKICKNSSMQSGQLFIPKVDNVFTVKELTNYTKNYDLVICFWEQSNKLLDYNFLFDKFSTLEQNSNIAIIIGPEGGICESEIDYLESNCHNFITATMGDCILRAETASLFACSIVKWVLDAAK